MIIILPGNCLDVLPTLAAGSVQACVTSPPYYGLRDYGVAGQLGLEATPDAYVAQLVAVFREVRRVLADDATCWLNIGDSYASSGDKQTGRNDAGRNFTGGGGNTLGSGNPGKQGSRRFDYGCKPKDLLMIPARVALALQADGWFLRSDIIWHKPNPMPESVTDRPTSAHEHVFLLTKNARYFYNQDEAREPHTAEPRAPGGYNPDKAVGPMDRGGSSQWDKKRSTKESYHPDGRNWRNVWTIATEPSGLAHFAMMPTELAERCIKAGSRPGDTVLDPFGGAGTTALVADRLQRNAVIVELNPVNVGLARGRIADDAGMFAVVA